VFPGSNRGVGHAPPGSVSKADPPSSGPTTVEGSGRPLSGQDDEQPARPTTAPVATAPRYVLRRMEGIDSPVVTHP
jgi:hypothetical protein